MRLLQDIRGLKYPDEYVVRHFFKRGLDRRAGRILELGCGSGNNLALYQAYGWDCSGIDRDVSALADARHNLGDAPRLIEADLCGAMPAMTGKFDVLLLPNLLCYLRLAHARALLHSLKPMLNIGCEIFVRARLVDDYRYGRGEELEPDGFRMSCTETGEERLFMHFYTHDNLVRLLRDSLGLTEHVQLMARFDNLQAGKLIVGNSDIVVWGLTS